MTALFEALPSIAEFHAPLSALPTAGQPALRDELVRLG